MGSIVLTAAAALADAERTIDKESKFRRKQAQQELSLAVEFCRRLIEPVNEYGPGFAHIPGFAETYCRKHLAGAAHFLRHETAVQESSTPEHKRLSHIGGLVEESLKHYLDEETAKLCWFGDDNTIVLELEKHGNFG
ncbi:MAG: hypothetical protein ACLPWG_05200 [Steroidobacteraceae bacterium]